MAASSCAEPSERDLTPAASSEEPAEREAAPSDTLFPPAARSDIPLVSAGREDTAEEAEYRKDNGFDKGDRFHENIPRNDDDLLYHKIRRNGNIRF